MKVFQVERLNIQIESNWIRIDHMFDNNICCHVVQCFQPQHVYNMLKNVYFINSMFFIVIRCSKCFFVQIICMKNFTKNRARDNWIHWLSKLGFFINNINFINFNYLVWYWKYSSIFKYIILSKLKTESNLCKMFKIDKFI